MPQDNATYKFTRLFGSTRAPVGAQIDHEASKTDRVSALRHQETCYVVHRS